MVKGISQFKEFFKDYQDQFVLIGGSASYLNLQQSGLEFRATKDLDIVIVIEVLNKDFVSRFWEFVKLGEYEFHKPDRSICFYRFQKPKVEGFPYMLEILSRNDSLGEIPEEIQVKKLSISDEITSLSAIILDGGYYELITEQRIIIDDIPCANTLALILLKMKACINLAAGKANGEKIKSDDIKKHKYDVFRLAQLLSGSERLQINKDITKDVLSFMNFVNENPFQLRVIKLPGNIETYFKQFRDIFGLSNI